MAGRAALVAVALAIAAPPAAAQQPDTTLHLRLNIPAYRLDVMRAARAERAIHVAIGRRIYPTPTGTFRAAAFSVP